MKMFTLVFNKSKNKWFESQRNACQLTICALDRLFVLRCGAAAVRLRSFIRHQLVGQVNFVSLEERAKSHEKRTEELSSSE
jgi:hypothetical protein